MAETRKKVETLCDDIEQYLEARKCNREAKRKNRVRKVTIQALTKPDPENDYNVEKSLRMSPVGESKKYNALREQVDILKLKLSKFENQKYCALEDELETKRRKIERHQVDLDKLNNHYSSNQSYYSSLETSTNDNRYDALKDQIKQSKYTIFNLKTEIREEEDLQMQKHREMVSLSSKIKFWEDKVKQKEREIANKSVQKDKIRNNSEYKSKASIKNIELVHQSKLRSGVKLLSESKQELRQWRTKRAKIRRSIESHKSNNRNPLCMNMKINIMSNKINELGRQIYEPPHNYVARYNRSQNKSLNTPKALPKSRKSPLVAREKLQALIQPKRFSPYSQNHGSILSENTKGSLNRNQSSTNELIRMTNVPSVNSYSKFSTCNSVGSKVKASPRIKLSTSWGKKIIKYIPITERVTRKTKF
ncbi:unnamed protein product [Moneuplotes crassus]|uniref:Uncharacterized protein n=1 Tax=Euplotes crassus TaxID=5936 RepID=A0AAD1UDE2_EUPCR|nr:unnamed protein product [Moneuplotes crassus]